MYLKDGDKKDVVPLCMSQHTKTDQRFPGTANFIFTALKIH